MRSNTEICEPFRCRLGNQILLAFHKKVDYNARYEENFYFINVFIRFGVRLRKRYFYGQTPHGCSSRNNAERAIHENGSKIFRETVGYSQ